MQLGYADWKVRSNACRQAARAIWKIVGCWGNHLRSTASMIPTTARVAQVQADINLVDKRGQSPLWLGSHMSRDLNYRKVIICGAFTADVFSWFCLG